MYYKRKEYFSDNGSGLQVSKITISGPGERTA